MIILLRILATGTILFVGAALAKHSGNGGIAWFYGAFSMMVSMLIMGFKKARW